MSKAELLEQIRKRILDELHDHLRESAQNLVFGKGNPNARIMFIGEAPGEQEDVQGVPFVGRAGRELDKLMRSIGLTLDDAYVANILKYRPPNNRDPTNDEIKAHTPYLVDQIKAIQPKVVITLGNFSTKFVLADFDTDRMKSIGGISFLHGKSVQKSINGLQFKVYPLYHPAAILYKPGLRQELEKDFLGIKLLLDQQ